MILLSHFLGIRHFYQIFLSTFSSGVNVVIHLLTVFEEPYILNGLPYSGKLILLGTIISNYDSNNALFHCCYRYQTSDIFYNPRQ